MVWPAVIGAAAGIGGALIGRASAQGQADASGAMQREFAQHGIRWRVADARAAGLHPLAALGASTSSPTPIAINDPLPNAMANAGQDISRAIVANADEEDRREAEARMFMLEAARRSDERVYRAQQEAREERRLQLDESNNTIRNMVLLEQLNRLRGTGTGPGMPGGRGDGVMPMFGAVKPKAAEPISRDPKDSSREAGVHGAWRQIETAPGVSREWISPEMNLDSEILHAIYGAQAHWDKWSAGEREKIRRDLGRFRGFFNRGGPSNMMFEQPSYRRYGVNRRGM